MLELVVRNIAETAAETGPAAKKVTVTTPDGDKEEPPCAQDEPDEPPSPRYTPPICATTSNEDDDDVAGDFDDVYDNVYDNTSGGINETAKTSCKSSDSPDSDDNSEVVFISERSLTLADSDQASPGSYSAPRRPRRQSGRRE